MPVQTIGLDYGWLVNLADMISRARQQPTGSRGATGVGAGAREPGKTDYQLEREQRREDIIAEQQRKHEIALKQMEIDSKLAEAMSAERIAGVGAEAGIEEARITGAAGVAAAQKTTMEKGYEFVEMLMDMDKESADELISNLLIKETQGQTERPISTITAGGVTKELPRGVPEEDPNNPLTWLRTVGFDPEAGAPRPKPTGAAAKPETVQFNELIDDMLTKNPQHIIALTTGKGWDEAREAMRTIGGEAGFSEETIDSVIAMYEAIVPEYKELPEEGGGLAGAIRGALTPFGLGGEELPPEAVPGAEAYLGGAGALKGAPLVEKAPGFAKNLEEFIETIITGPFHPAYKKWKGKKAGKVVKAEEKEELTEQDVITEMRTWSKEKVEEFQTVAKKAGIYKGPINGLHSNELDDVMRKYFKEHPEEWGETK